MWVWIYDSGNNSLDKQKTGEWHLFRKYGEMGRGRERRRWRPDLSLRWELKEHECLTWPCQPHTRLSLLRRFSYKVCLTWTNIIINTSFLNNTSVLSASKSARGVSSRHRTSFFLLNPPFCCVVKEHGGWVTGHKSRLEKHLKKNTVSMLSSLNHPNYWTICVSVHVKATLWHRNACFQRKTGAVELLCASLWHEAEKNKVPAHKCQRDARVLGGDFPWPESENDFITEEDEESYLWFPPTLGWLFLEPASRPESFPRVEHLCSLNEN